MSVDIAMISACTHMPRDIHARVVRPEALGQVAAGDDPELGRQVLDQHRHQVRQHDDPQQQEAELGAALEVRGEVAGVDVGDRRRRRPGRASPASRAAGPWPAAARAGSDAPRPRAARPARRRPWRPRAPGSRIERRRGVTGSPRRASPGRALRRAPASALAEAHEQRAVERLACRPPRACRRARSRARPGSGASRGRSPTPARSVPRSPTSSAWRLCGRALLDRRGRRVGIGSPCGSTVGSPSLAAISSSSSSESTCSSTSASCVDAVPGHARASRPDTARAGGGGGSPRARRAGPSSVRRHAAVGLVLDQPELVQALDHRRDRAPG